MLTSFQHNVNNINFIPTIKSIRSIYHPLLLICFIKQINNNIKFPLKTHNNHQWKLITPLKILLMTCISKFKDY